MLVQMRSRWMAGAGALLLVLTMSGLAAAATLVDDTTPATLATFEDLNGNGIDDDCETGVTAAPDAVTAVMAAVDTNADGVISVTEAAHSDWVGGTNCNHGGYVSTVAQASDECDEGEAPEGTTEDADEGSEDSAPAAIEASTDTPTAATDCAADAPESETSDAAKAACEAGVLVDPTVLAAMTHVEIAQSDLVGGKNCNHGGLVSESAKAQQAEKQAAREARQAARELTVHGKAGKHKKGHSGQ
jgi:hypothetical protein